MGREAQVHAEVDTENEEVKALLESRELILRGDIRRHFPKAAMRDVQADGDVLRFSCAGEAVSLRLGGKAAEAWAKAIASPLPSLRAKLGLDKGARAFLIGACDDAELADALQGRLTDKLAEAAMLVAHISGPSDLAVARKIQARSAQLPVWAIYRKGKDAVFGDSAIRAALREAGFRDTKSCAVSDQLTATRYAPITAAPALRSSA